MVIEDVRDGEEEVALFLVREAVFAAEAVLLGDAREAEGLAGKAAAEDVELGNVLHLDLIYVARRLFAEVGGVSLPAEPVPVAGEDAPRARPLEGDPEAANATEEVDEAERRALLGVRRVRPSGARRSDAVGRCFLPQRRRGCASLPGGYPLAALAALGSSAPAAAG